MILIIIQYFTVSKRVKRKVLRNVKKNANFNIWCRPLRNVPCNRCSDWQVVQSRWSPYPVFYLYQVLCIKHRLDLAIYVHVWPRWIKTFLVYDGCSSTTLTSTVAFEKLLGENYELFANLMKILKQDTPFSFKKSSDVMSFLGTLSPEINVEVLKQCVKN